MAFYKWENFAKYKWNADYDKMLYRRLHCARPLSMILELEDFVKVLLALSRRSKSLARNTR